MRRVILSLITSCGLFNLVTAQKTIEIDFSPMTTPTIKVNDINKIKKGEYYQIKIKNINLNLFKVSLTLKDTILSKPEQTPMFGNFDFDALSKIIEGISPLSTSIKTYIRDEAEDDCIIRRLNLEIDTLAYANQSVEKIAKRIDSLKLNVYKIRLYSLRLDSLKPGYPSSSYNVSQSLMDIDTIRKDINNLKPNIIALKVCYEKFAATHKQAIESNKDFASKDKSIKESYDKLLSVLTDALSSISADKTYELLSPIVLIQNNSNNTYTSLPFQFMGEQAKVKISIVPRDEKYNLQSYYTQIVIPQEIANYTVPGISFYVSNLHNKAYSIIKTQVNDSTSSYILKEEKVSKAELGIATLLRYGGKLNDKNCFGVHLDIGAGISISNKIKPRFLLGGGLSFWGKHMLAIDCGVIWGYVDRLSDAKDLSETYNEEPENITVSKIGVGVFGAVGYIYQF